MTRPPEEDSLLAAVARVMALCDVPEDAELLVAVSGGGDSVALLHLLHRMGRKVVALHGNHQSRGAESEADARFVADLAASLGISAVIENLTLDGEGSFEMRARAARHQFFRRMARDRGTAWVALGHTRDDQAETLLLRIIRGTGPDGLGGMAYKTALRDLKMVRPLLGQSRAALRAWLEGEGLSWREDSSNASPDYQRNRVRHEVLPLLESFNPEVVSALNRLAAIQRSESFVIANHYRQMKKYVFREGKLFKGGFLLLPDLQYRLLRDYAWRCGVDLSFAQVGRARRFVLEAQPGARFDLGKGVQWVQGRDYVMPALAGPAPEAQVLTPPCDLRYGPYQVRCYFQEARGQEPQEVCTPWRQVFDPQIGSTPLTLRAMRPGDRIDPLGMAGSKRVKKLLSERGVATPLRPHVPVLCQGDTVLWVVGHPPPSRHALVNESSETWLVVDLSRENDDAPESKALD